jgi:hypothetical protein
VFETILDKCNEGITMYKNTGKAPGRVTAVAFLGMALTAGSVGVASASGSQGASISVGDAGGVTSSGVDCSSGIRGLVTAVSATSVTVQGFDGTITTFIITPTTTFAEGGVAATATMLVVGDRVEVSALSTSATTAAKIDIDLARFFGTVTAVGTGTITISDMHGFSRVIVVGSTTTYTLAGTASTLSAVTVGAMISARGTVDANRTSLDALTVAIGSDHFGQSTSTSWQGGKKSHAEGRGERGFSRFGGHRH